VRDVLRGHLAWITFRLVTVCAIYLAIMEAFGTLRSGLAVLAIPAGVLAGLAFVAPIMAFAGAQQNDRGFSALYRFGLIPLFLFSGTFFPISQLPRWLQFVAWATPLYHAWRCARARPRRSGRRAGRRPHGLPRSRRRDRLLARDPELREETRDMTATVTTPLRITPLSILGSRRALRLIERNIYVYRRSWIIFVSGFFEPFF